MPLRATGKMIHDTTTCSAFRDLYRFPHTIRPAGASSGKFGGDNAGCAAVAPRTGHLPLTHGNRYEGQCRNNYFQGQGTLYLNNGDRYQGQFSNDQKNGQGTYFYANGDRFEGMFRNGKRNGAGTLLRARRPLPGQLPARALCQGTFICQWRPLRSNWSATVSTDAAPTISIMVISMTASGARA
ncbi:MAG: MORN repeat-containing protein [Pseudohongiellaceae bacterium]